MTNNVLLQELERYSINTIEDIKNTLREISQKIILSGLARGKIFDHVVFYGGTSLRLLHNLDRFSEDIDFTLIKENKEFEFEKYLKFAVNEMNSFGLNATMSIKEKNIETSILTGYIKFNLFDAIKLCFNNENFNVNKEENISIKVEVETKINKGFNLEYKTILFPSFFKVLTFDFSTLFSSKLIAILNRSWKNRVKGRDYFDFLFYITNQVSPNYKYLSSGLGLESLNREELKKLLIQKFNDVDFNLVLKDIYPFVQKDSRFLPLFKKDTFIDLVNEIK